MTVTMRYAMKIAYDGTKFCGSQRQPKVRTVDGECIFMLKKINAITGAQDSHYQSASRTDAGVSAAGNVISFDTGMDGKALIGAFNSGAKDVWAYAIREVPDDFNARKAIRRWYRYHLPKNLDYSRTNSATMIFRGKHDFKWFSRATQGDTTRTVDSIELRRESDFLIMDIRGRSFLWSMVRRIVSAVELYSKRQITIRQIREALRGVKHDFGLAPAQPLILMDVIYDFKFKITKIAKVENEVRQLLKQSQLDVSKWMIINDAIRVI